MDRYIARKPARFDKDYAVGDVIPSDVIEPRNVKRLIEWGKIQLVSEHSDLNTEEAEVHTGAFAIDKDAVVQVLKDSVNNLTDESALSIADALQQNLETLLTVSYDVDSSDDEDDPETNTAEPYDGDSAPSQKSTGETETQTGENGFACEVCGRVMRSKSTLTTHIRKEHTNTK